MANNTSGKKDNPTSDKQNITKAHDQAESDIQNDPEFTDGPEKGDDLDEGELANLEGEK